RTKLIVAGVAALIVVLGGGVLALNALPGAGQAKPQTAAAAAAPTTGVSTPQSSGASQPPAAPSPVPTPSQIEALYQQGIASFNKGDYWDAAYSLKQVDAQQPNYKDTQAKLAEAREKAGVLAYMQGNRDSYVAGILQAGSDPVDVVATEDVPLVLPAWGNRLLFRVMDKSSNHVWYSVSADGRSKVQIGAGGQSNVQATTRADRLLIVNGPPSYTERSPQPVESAISRSDGTGRRTVGKGWDWVMSPNGDCALGWSRSPDGRLELHLVNLDSLDDALVWTGQADDMLEDNRIGLRPWGPRELDSMRSGSMVMGPSLSFSDDGSHFLAVIKNGSLLLGDTRARTMSQVQLPATNMHVYMAAFAPGGATVLASDGGSGMVFYDIASKRATMVSVGVRSFAWPSPDGKRFLVGGLDLSQQAGPPRLRVSLVDASGGVFREVLSITGYMVDAPRWLAGNRLLMSYDSMPVTGRSDPHAMLLNPDGTKVWEAAGVGVVQGVPDGGQFGLVQQGFGTNVSLIAVGTDWNARRVIGQGDTTWPYASVFPDGKKLVYSMSDEAPLYMANIDGSGTTKVFDNGMPLGWFATSQ
ncbi:MAG: hypothetical protein M1380_06550, partial [Chloroflexi bacterium]|nr:hypothetical protein [Chloroflexota bacterium]